MDMSDGPAGARGVTLDERHPSTSLPCPSALRAMRATSPLVGSDHEGSHGGRHVPNYAPAVACSVLHHDIAGGQQQFRAIVDLDYQVAGEKNPEVRRVGSVHAWFVAVFDVHLGSGFWCNHVELR